MQQVTVTPPPPPLPFHCLPPTSPSLSAQVNCSAAHESRSKNRNVGANIQARKPLYPWPYALCLTSPHPPLPLPLLYHPPSNPLLHNSTATRAKAASLLSPAPSSHPRSVSAMEATCISASYVFLPHYHNNAPNPLAPFHRVSGTPCATAGQPSPPPNTWRTPSTVTD